MRRVDADTEVGLNIILPLDLHRLAKGLAGTRSISLRQLVIDSLTGEVARAYGMERAGRGPARLRG